MLWLWMGFIFFVLLMLALDLGVFHRHAHVVSLGEALAWSAVWVALAMLFNVFVYFAYNQHLQGLGTTPTAMHPQGLDGASAAVLFFTGYVLEKSLSVDNLFVIALIFSYFAIPPLHQHRVLLWGILGALVLRGIMIGAGAALVARFEWILYVFGAMLVLTAVKMLRQHEQPSPAHNPMVRLLQRSLPITGRLYGQRFVVPRQELEPDDPLRTSGVAARWAITPLALALVVVESSDVVFAIDSIPAVFAVTTDPFLVFTSNIFAILGLRSLYFALAGILHRFYYLRYALAVILAVVGAKMLLMHWIRPYVGEHLSLYTLGLITLVLTAGILASLRRGRQSKNQTSSRT